MTGKDEITQKIKDQLKDTVRMIIEKETGQILERVTNAVMDSLQQHVLVRLHPLEGDFGFRVELYLDPSVDPNTTGRWNR